MIVCILLDASMSVLPAGAKPPSPANSTWPVCVVVCPAGDFELTVITRDLSNNPKPGSSVEIDWCDSCGTTVIQCPYDGSEDFEVVSNCRVRKLTDSTGTATFHIRAGGVCIAGATIRADGVLFERVPVLSPDANGDRIVDSDDHVLWTERAASMSPLAELNCLEPVDESDEVILIDHMGPVCTGSVPVARPSWGRLKTIYR